MKPKAVKCGDPKETGNEKRAVDRNKNGQVKYFSHIKRLQSYKSPTGGENRRWMNSSVLECTTMARVSVRDILQLTFVEMAADWLIDFNFVWGGVGVCDVAALGIKTVLKDYQGHPNQGFGPQACTQITFLYSAMHPIQRVGPQACIQIKESWHKHLWNRFVISASLSSNLKKLEVEVCSNDDFLCVCRFRTCWQMPASRLALWPAFWRS